MLMETFALADNDWEARSRKDLHPYETYKKRLVRVDLPPRSDSRDIIQHSLGKFLRATWFFLRRTRAREEGSDPFKSAPGLESSSSWVKPSDPRSGSSPKKTYQNTTHLAEVIARFLVAILAGAFLVVPMVVLSHQSNKETQTITISICILVFALLVSLISKASNEQTMAGAAGYAAVLVVFLSNSSVS